MSKVSATLDAHAAQTPVSATNGTSADDFARIPRFGRSPRNWPAPLAEPAFHGLAGDIVRTIEPHTEADPAALLVSLLVAAGSVFGPGIHARTEGDIHRMNLFAAIVGDTSKARKGTSWGRVSQIVGLAEHEWPARVCGGLSSGEGLIWQVRDPIVARKRARSEDEKERAEDDGYVTETIDEGVEDKRLLVQEGEFASCLRVMRRDTNTLSAVLRNLWDRGEVGSMTKNSPARTTGALVSVLAHIVSEELRRELGETDSANGFANRFLWICSTRSKSLPDGGSLTEEQLRPLANQLAAAITFAHSERELKRTQAARTLWHQIYPDLSAGRPGLLGAITSRAEAQVLRVSLIYAALDRATAVSDKHLRAALAVWNYSEQSARFIFGDRLGDSVADTIADALAERDSGLSRTDIRNLFGRHQPSDRIEQALDLLERLDVVDRVTVSTGGRPQELITLVNNTGAAAATEATKASEDAPATGVAR